MTTVHILSEGFVSPNGAAFLFPLVVHRRALAERGIRWRLFTSQTPALYECDLLLVDSKVHRSRWRDDTPGVLAEFARMAEHGPRLLYVDTTDSSGWVQSLVLPLVDGYLKSQLLADRSLYEKPLYGARIYCDYVHREFGIKDSDEIWYEPPRDPAELAKLRLSWGSALADYSYYGRHRMVAYRRLPLAGVLRYPRAGALPSAARPVVACGRMSLRYARESVAWQRREVVRRLQGIATTGRVSRREYFKEMRDSRVVLSPFGYGEINYRDYEVFLAGAVLLKPDMSHLRTWPELYRDGETYVAHRWDLTDLQDRLDAILADYPRYMDVARDGQANYLRHLSGPGAQALFCERVEQMLEPYASGR